VFTRVAVGRERVVREVRAAGPLMAALKAPVPARGPWLTAVLNDGALRVPRRRPVAVVIEPHAQGRPEAVAFLEVRRRGPLTQVLPLGADLAPPGRPGVRLLAGGPDSAALLAAGICGYLDALRRPWTMRLTGLPMGDPVVRELAVRLPTAVVATERSRQLLDDLDGDVLRSRDPAVLEKWLPTVVAPRFVRAAARLHSAIGQLDLAVAPDGAALLALVDGDDRWPWWATGGLATGMGFPLVSLTVPARWPR
jgi:hypothetical protein